MVLIRRNHVSITQHQDPMPQILNALFPRFLQPQNTFDLGYLSFGTRPALEDPQRKHITEEYIMARAKQNEAAELAQDDQAEKVAAKTSKLGENAIDDPVRMYLMQMGRIPLLIREEEISAATKIDIARSAFRNNMLATDSMLRGAIDAL